VESLKKFGSVSGETLYASHESLRYQYECSTPELDWFVDRAKRIVGVRGARLTGAGWGGCAIAVGDFEALDRRPTRAHFRVRSFVRSEAEDLAHERRGGGKGGAE